MHAPPLAAHDAADVLELFLLTTLTCQIELLAVRLYADFDSSFSIEHVGAFRSVKGLGPTIKII